MSGIPKPIWLPLIVAALVLPIILAAFLGGTALAVFVAILVLLAIVVLVTRGRRGPIEVAPDDEKTRHVLLAISEPVDSPAAAREVARATRLDGASDAEVLALAPTQPGFLDRWASDVRTAHEEAERKLALTVDSLANERLRPRAEVGESDLVLAVEDSLRTFPADEVILVTGPRERDRSGAAAAEDLRERLPVPFDHISVDD